MQLVVFVRQKPQSHDLVGWKSSPMTVISHNFDWTPIGMGLLIDPQVCRHTHIRNTHDSYIHVLCCLVKDTKSMHMTITWLTARHLTCTSYLTTHATIHKHMCIHTM